MLMLVLEFPLIYEYQYKVVFYNYVLIKLRHKQIRYKHSGPAMLISFTAFKLVEFPLVN